MPDELISGATDTQYVPTNPDDLGRYVYCRVRGDNAFGFSTANSNVIGPIAVASDLVNTDPPEITIASGGDSLTSDTGTWTGSPTITHGYLWFQADDAAGTGAVSIPLAISPTYAIDGGTITAPAAGSTWSATDKTAHWELDGTLLIATVDASAGAANVAGRGSLSNSSGKKYFEVTITSIDLTGNPSYLGLADAVVTIGTGLPGSANSNGIVYRLDIGYIQARTDAEFYSGLPTFANGDVLGVAVDLTNHLAWFSKNGTWVRGDPAAATLPADYGATAGPAMFVFGGTTGYYGVNYIFALNTGGSAFAHSPPTGFTAWG